MEVGNKNSIATKHLLAMKTFAIKLVTLNKFLFFLSLTFCSLHWQKEKIAKHFIGNKKNSCTHFYWPLKQFVHFLGFYIFLAFHTAKCMKMF